MLYCDPFENLDNLREEGIRDLRDDQPKNAATTRNQGPCLSVGIIAKLFNNVPNAFRHLWVDGGNAINGTRNGRRRHACSFSNFADIHNAGSYVDPGPIVRAILAQQTFAVGKL